MRQFRQFLQEKCERRACKIKRQSGNCGTVMNEMKPGERPRLLRLTMGGSFDGTSGSNPEQDQPVRWLG
jgi:hypothetical protein